MFVYDFFKITNTSDYESQSENIWNKEKLNPLNKTNEYKLQRQNASSREKLNALLNDYNNNKL